MTRKELEEVFHIGKEIQDLESEYTENSIRQAHNSFREVG